jgi:hypothetical protein
MNSARSKSIFQSFLFYSYIKYCIVLFSIYSVPFGMGFTLRSEALFRHTTQEIALMSMSSPDQRCRSFKAYQSYSRHLLHFLSPSTSDWLRQFRTQPVQRQRRLHMQTILIGGQPLHLHRDAAHVWLIDSRRVDLTADGGALLRRCRAVLAPEERARFDRGWSASATRDQAASFLLARVLLRSALSRYFPCTRPADWLFAPNAYGRPEIVVAGEDPLPI